MKTEEPTRATVDTRDGDRLSTFAPGSNVLVRGTSLAGKRALGIALLAALPTDERPVVLSAAADAATLERRLAAAGNATVSDRWYVVDAVRSQVDGGTIACTDGGDRRTWFVTSPSDLTGLGMSTSRAVSAIVDDGDRPRLLVDSLSTLLQYSSLERVYRFLHVLNGRMAAVGGVTLQVLHSDAHDAQTVGTLAHLFDTVLDVRTEDGVPVVVRTGTGGESTVPMGDLLAELATGEPTPTV
jgi:KaiC/GvpD/RAD55 family RecA-like ATPase